jgi:hypothetical protein
MKAKLLQIHWHEREPIYALHCDHFGRLATAGGDHTIRVTIMLPLSISHSTHLIGLYVIDLEIIGAY